MNVELSAEYRVAMHAALGDPTRLVIADALSLGDLSPGELLERVRVGSNLLAHHLGVLEAAGVVIRGRSEADRRRTYVTLAPNAVPFVVPHPTSGMSRIVFVCTHNSARSQLAAAVWARHSTVPGTSAGTQPAQRVHPRAAHVAREHGLSLTGARTAHIDEVVRRTDLLVAVCDRAYESNAIGREILHWSVPDPVRNETDESFSSAFTDISQRVGRLADAITEESRR